MNMLEALRDSHPRSALVLQVIGALIVLRHVGLLLARLYKLFRRRANLKARYGSGSWAFVTGSSEGIGRALAISLAKEGFNIILSARTESKLKQVSATIQAKHPNIQVRVLPADYKKAIDCNYITSLLEQVSDLDISIVVNNVGVDLLQKFTEADPQKLQDMIALNCYPASLISRYFIPRMLERMRTHRGSKCAIINISSTAGVLSLPYFQTYCATKAYIDRLTTCLKAEYPQLDIMSVRPSEVSTPMTCNKDLDIFTITAEQCAQGILDDVGQEVVCYGHWRHKLQGWLYEALPQRLINFVFMKAVLPQELARRKAKTN